MAVDCILSALGEDISEGSETGDEDDFGDSDDALSDNDGPDDSMNLIQYQKKISKGNQSSQGVAGLWFLPEEGKTGDWQS